MDFEKYNLHMKVLAAIDLAESNKIVDRIKFAATRSYEDSKGELHQFTWRTISTWYYRFKKGGHTHLLIKRRADKGSRRKVCVEKIAEAIHEIMPSIRRNKKNKIVVTAVYRMILEKGFFKVEDLSYTTFTHIVRDKCLLTPEINKEFRTKFAMLHANEMWQADTLVGPFVHDPSQDKKRKTYLIAFIDDASRLITHAEFFFHDDEQSLASAFQTALAKRGKPQLFYCDNGSNYSSKTLQMACIRLGIKLSHAPVRDGSAKGKIERFFRTFRDQFLTINHDLSSLENLNKLTTNWVENEYNDRYHSSIQMKPIDRFAIDRNKIEYLPNEDFIDEVFFVEEDRKVSKDNTFRFDRSIYEAPVHLREQTIQIRFHPKKRDNIIVFFKDKKMGYANAVDLYFNAKTFRKNEDAKTYFEKKEVQEIKTETENKTDSQVAENQYFQSNQNFNNAEENQ